MSKQGRQKGLFELKGEFVSERLSNDLRRRIESGALKHGEVVKPVRELMKQYGISYNSVRKALNQLAQEGYLTLEQGRGTFVKGAKVPRLDKPLPNVPKQVADQTPDMDSEVEEMMPMATECESDEASVAPAAVTVDTVIDREAETIESEEIRHAATGAVPGGKGDVGVFVAPGMGLGEGFGLVGALRVFVSLALHSGRAARLIAVGEGGLGSSVEKFGGRCLAVWGFPVHARDVEAVAGGGRACVSVGCWPARGEVSGVMPDNFGGAYELGRRLLAGGHRRMAFLGMRRAHGAAGGVVVGGDARERLSGCRVAWEEVGIDLPESHIIGATAADEWLADRVLGLKPRPTAVVVSGQKLAEVLIGQLKERGTGVPRVLSVACFGAQDEPNPMDIASMRVDWSRAGQCAWARLRELEAGAPAERLRIGLPVEFHEGRTIGTTDEQR